MFTYVRAHANFKDLQTIKNPTTMNKRADNINCTYWWIMHLDRKHTFNKMDNMYGYGKFQGDDEALDKEKLLMRHVTMLFKEQENPPFLPYINRCHKIDIYKKKQEGLIPSKKDWHVLTLLPHDFSIPPEMLKYFPASVKTFLSKFYAAILSGKKITHLIPMKKAEQNPFNNDITKWDVSTYSFKTYAQLLSWANSMGSKGHPPGRINDFIIKYCDAKPFKQAA